MSAHPTLPDRADSELLLEELRRAGATVKGRNTIACPFHEDKHPSGGIYQGDDGAWRYKCQGGSCGFHGDLYDVRARATGVPLAEVLKAASGGNGKAAPGRSRPATAGDNGKRRLLRTYATVEAAIADAERITGGILVECRPYPGGCFKMARFNLPKTDGNTGKPHKTFRPLHKTDAGWILADPPGLLPLYRGDELPAEGLVTVTEGERCADAAWGVGLPAVTSAHGARAAARSDWTPLANRDVFVLPDNDDAGRRYATEVAEILASLDPPARVRLLDLPNLPASTVSTSGTRS